MKPLSKCSQLEACLALARGPIQCLDVLEGALVVKGESSNGLCTLFRIIPQWHKRSFRFMQVVVDTANSIPLHTTVTSESKETSNEFE